MLQRYLSAVVADLSKEVSFIEWKHAQPDVHASVPDRFSCPSVPSPGRDVLESYSAVGHLHAARVSPRFQTIIITPKSSSTENVVTKAAMTEGEQITPTLQTTPIGSRWLPPDGCYSCKHTLFVAPNGSLWLPSTYTA